MEEKAKKSRLARVPDWALSLFTVIALFIILRIGHDPKSTGFGTIQIIVWILYLMLVTVACYMICRTHPKSVWYTPVICNIIGIIGLFANIGLAIATAIVGRGYETLLVEWIFIVSSVVLSVTGAIVGARIGRRRINQAT